MRWNSSTLVYFSKTNPNDVFSFWRAHKINCFLEEVIDFESFNLLNSVQFIKKKKSKVVFEKNWLSLDNFLILFAFLKMLNESSDKMREFFSGILSEYYPSDQIEAQRIMEEVYCCINDKLLNCLSLDSSHPNENKLESSGGVINTNNRSVEVVAQDKRKKVPQEIFDKSSGFSEKKNPFGFGFEECAPMQARVNQLYKEFIKEGKPSANYEYASNTIKSLMRRSVRKEHPSMAAKQVFGYIAGGVCLAIAVAAIVYLTIQTAGLIHLTWIAPVAILALTAGVSAVGGTAAILRSTPSISNRIYNFFKEKEADKTPILGELFVERRPIGMIV